MSEEKQDKPAAAAPVTAAKPPKKLQPRVAAEPESVAAAKPVVKKAVAGKPVAKKPSALEETKARNKKALAEALAKAQAVQLAPPVVTAQLPELPPPAKPPVCEIAPPILMGAPDCPRADGAEIAKVVAIRNAASRANLRR